MSIRTLIALAALAPALAMAQAGAENPAAAPTMPKEDAVAKVNGSSQGAIVKARVFFIEPKAGATVKSSGFKVKFGLEGMRIAKAGAIVPGTGHHHLIIDGGPTAKGKVVGKDATHLHFGDGQTETTLKLAPGPHTLTLQFADGSHASYGEELSATIPVTAK